MARCVVGLDHIRAEGKVRCLEARLAAAKSDSTQVDRAVEESDGTGRCRTTAYVILDSSGQGDRPPEVRRFGLCCQDGSRGGECRGRRGRGVDRHTHQVGVAGSECRIAAVGGGDGVSARHQRRDGEGCLIQASHFGQADGSLLLTVDRERDGPVRVTGRGGDNDGCQGDRLARDRILGCDVEGGRRGHEMGRDDKNAWGEPNDPVALGHEQRAVVGVHGDEVAARAPRGNDGLDRRRQVHFDDCPAIGVGEEISRHRPFTQGDAIRPARDRPGVEDQRLGRDVEAFGSAVSRSVEDPGTGVEVQAVSIHIQENRYRPCHRVHVVDLRAETRNEQVAVERVNRHAERTGREGLRPSSGCRHR